MRRSALTVLAFGLLLPGRASAQGETGDAPPPADPPATETAPPPAPATPPPSAPPASAPTNRPPPQYYVEPPEGGAQRGQRGAPPPGPPGYYEPPPPGYYPAMVYEPPPPPKPKHVAPKASFWLGVRGGWFIPFGNLWLDYSPTAGYEEVKWSEYASPGPMFELDIGARFGRYYNVFLLWERATLGTGSAAPDANGGQKSGDTDYYAIGLRFSSDPDRVGFLTEINLGYRRFRARWEDGTELQMTEAPLEFRIGLGADIRLNRFFSLSPLVTLGAGAFGNAELVAPNGTRSDPTSQGSEAAGHGWLTLQLGGHFDIAGGGD